MKMTKEKELLIGLIVSDEFIQQLAPIIHVNHLQATSSKTIAMWCIDYYDEYKKAPAMFIQDIYEQHKAQIQEDDAVIIAKVLQHVSQQYATKEKYNVPFMIDKARMYVRERRIAVLVEQLDHDVITGNIEKAETAIMGFTNVAKHDKRETNIYKDDTTVSNIFNKETSELFKLPGVVGEYIGAFRRGNLYAFSAPAKRGKSRWLAQTATVASINRYNTLYISLEMDEEETTEMLMNTLVRKPMREYPDDVEVTLPYFGEDNSILYNTYMEHPATEQDFKKWQKKATIMGAPIHRIIKEPDSTTLADLENEIMSLEYFEGFVPDVIVVDYANIIQGKGVDNRDKVNNIWIGLKSWAKRYHCAVITASHQNTEGLKKDGEAWTVGEDRRILNHVSGLYILNQTPEEKQAKIMRLKATATRFSKYGEADEVVCLYDYDTGRTLIASRWKKHVPDYNEE